MLRCATLGSIGLRTYLEWRKPLLAGLLCERQMPLSPRPALRSRNSRERSGSGLVNSYLPLDLGNCVEKMHQPTSLSVEDSTDLEVRRTVLQFRAVALAGGIVTADHHAAPVFKIENRSQGDQHG